MFHEAQIRSVKMSRRYINVCQVEFSIVLEEEGEKKKGEDEGRKVRMEWIDGSSDRIQPYGSYTAGKEKGLGRKLHRKETRGKNKRPSTTKKALAVLKAVSKI